MAYEVIQIDNNTWRIEDNGHVRFFLLTGEKEALMIDSGMSVENVKDIAAGLTDLPVKLINTHADRDHVGGNREFDEFYMHPSEASNYYNTQKQEGTFVPVEDGDIIDLGGRTLEVISIPGHTPGSIALLDIEKRVLISGDPIQDGLIFMFGVQREIHAYMASLRKLDKYRDRFALIYPSHGSIPVKPELIDELISVVERMNAGEFDYTEAEFHGTVVKKIDTGVASFLRDM